MLNVFLMLRVVSTHITSKINTVCDIKQFIYSFIFKKIYLFNLFFWLRRS